jgi:steroid delta-isomerase-like uncharacterized protein
VATTSEGPNTEIMRRVYRLLDGGDIDGLRTTYADDVEMVTPDEHVSGVEAALSILRSIHTAFPDLRHELLAAIEEGDAVATEWRVTGTNTGPLLGLEGEIPPTGKRLDVTFAEFARIDDGRIARSVSYWDNAAFAEQLGLV